MENLGGTAGGKQKGGVAKKHQKQQKKQQQRTTARKPQSRKNDELFHLFNPPKPEDLDPTVNQNKPAFIGVVGTGDSIRSRLFQQQRNLKQRGARPIFYSTNKEQSLDVDADAAKVFSSNTIAHSIFAHHTYS